MSDNEPKKKKRLRNFSLFLIVVLALSCCGIYSLSNTAATSITSTSGSGNRTSGSSVLPTNTPERFDPIRVTGRGDDVVAIDKPNVPAIVQLSHQGSSNFVVTSYDTNGNHLELLVNEIGSYNGIRPLDFAANDLTGRLEIQADGSWVVEVKPLSAAQVVLVPATNFSGKGDMVLLLGGADPDTATLAHTGESNFVVQAYGNSRRLLVNEIGNYDGTVIVPSDTAVLEIVADGGWQLAITGQ